MFCGALFYGLYLALFALSTYFLCRRGLFHSRVLMVLWSATIIMFATSTSYIGLGLASTVYRIWVLLNSGGLAVSSPSSPLVTRILNAQMYLPIINFIVSDAIVIWRAWVLWERRVIVLLLPAIFFAGTIISAIISAVHDVDVKVSVSSNPDYRVVVLGKIVVWSLTIATNILATLLVAWKAWQHRRVIKKNLGKETRRTRVEKILALLIESGFLYCIIWILFIAANFEVFGDVGRQIMMSIMVQITGIYPTLVVVLVSLQRTSLDETTNELLSRPHFATFGTHSVMTTTDSSTLSPSPDRLMSPLETLFAHETSKEEYVA